MKSAETMPESKFNYRPTKEVRSFAEIVTHVADTSYYLCSNARGEAPPARASGKNSKAEIMAYVKSSFDYCDGAYAAFSDAHLNDPADFWGYKTNKMFILTQRQSETVDGTPDFGRRHRLHFEVHETRPALGAP